MKQMEIKFNTPYNREDKPHYKEYNEDPSETIPGQTMTVLEMVERYRKGLPVEAGKIPIYNGEEPLPDLNDMDLADRQLVIEHYAEQLLEIRQRLEANAKSKAEKERLAEIDRQVKEKLTEWRKQQGKKDAIEDIDSE